MTRGSEPRNLIADITEKEMRIFFKDILKWDQGYFKFHPYKGGIDLYSSYFDKLEDRNIGILIDAKNIKEKEYFNRSKLEKDVEILKKKLIDIHKSKTVDILPDLRTPLNPPVYAGILFYRFEKYSREEFNQVINDYNISGNKELNPPLIMIVDNYIISRLYYLYRELGTNIEYYYPFHGNNYIVDYSDRLSIYYLFNGIIFGKFKDKKEEEKKFIFVKDKPEIRTYDLIADMIKTFHFGIPDVIIYGDVDRETAAYLPQLYQNSVGFNELIENKEIGTIRLEMNLIDFDLTRL